MTDELPAESEQLSPEQLREIHLLLGIPADEDAVLASYINGR